LTYRKNKETNNYLQNTSQKSKDLATWTTSRSTHVFGKG